MGGVVISAKRSAAQPNPEAHGRAEGGNEKKKAKDAELKRKREAKAREAQKARMERAKRVQAERLKRQEIKKRGRMDRKNLKRKMERQVCKPALILTHL